MEFKHFSHHHVLNTHKVQAGQPLLCSGCHALCYDTAYACWQCNYFLHEHCGNAVRYIKHPSHSQHHLILIPKPTYCSGSFICNACGQTGSAFSYCCALCEVDFHVHCAFLPYDVSHKSHQHDLTLCVSVEDAQSRPPEYCKICTKLLETKYMSYFCSDCEFGVHTYCVTTEVKPEQYLFDSSGSGTVPAEQNGSGAEENKPSEEEVIVGLYKLKLQMQMADQLAQMMASFNPL